MTKVHTQDKKLLQHW